MGRKRIIILASAGIVLAGTIIGFKLFTSPGAPLGMPEHITIAQAESQVDGQSVKVGGDVVPGSIRWDSTTGSLIFTLTGEGMNMQVVYPGPAPNDFKPGLPLVVDGTYTADGFFAATSLTMRSSPLCKACHQ